MMPKLCVRFTDLKDAEHGITGDILAQLDADTLKEIGIQTIGQRLAILKGVYQVKVNQSIEIEPGHYVPACELNISKSLGCLTWQYSGAGRARGTYIST